MFIAKKLTRISMFALIGLTAPLYSSHSMEAEVLLEDPQGLYDFKFEDHGLVDHQTYKHGPARISGLFRVGQTRENRHHFVLYLDWYTDKNEWIEIGSIIGEVAAGPCPSLISDGIYPAFGKHIRISKFNIYHDYQNSGLGTGALKLMFSLFDKMKLPYKLEVQKENARAIHFFHKARFKKVEDEENKIGCNFNDVFSMMRF